MKPFCCFGLAVLLPFVLVLTQAPKAGRNSSASRKFRFTYRATLKDLPSGARLARVWIPLAHSDEHQSVVLKKTTRPVATQVTTEPEYGNRILFAEIRRLSSSSGEFALEYEVTRREYSRGDYASLLRHDHRSARPPATLERFLRPDLLVPTGGKIKELADEITRGRVGEVPKARAVYESLFRTMRYDKSGTGWGRGDAVWACGSKRGNCTDFHSPFIGMMRAEKIPARFLIGFPIPEGAQRGEIPGYHCWAEFYLNGIGWIPVDISEAWKNPAKAEYFFGALDSSRVQFSIGRDITLAPKQDGPPLNYFVYPYVEVDGKPHDAVEKKFEFQEISPVHP